MSQTSANIFWLLKRLSRVLLTLLSGFQKGAPSESEIAEIFYFKSICNHSVAIRSTSIPRVNGTFSVTYRQCSEEICYQRYDTQIHTQSFPSKSSLQILRHCVNLKSKCQAAFMGKLKLRLPKGWMNILMFMISICRSSKNISTAYVTWKNSHLNVLPSKRFMYFYV